MHVAICECTYVINDKSPNQMWRFLVIRASQLTLKFIIAYYYAELEKFWSSRIVCIGADVANMCVLHVFTSPFTMQRAAMTQFSGFSSDIFS
jgi:hypothetical protein